jgi:hypothetical protein
LDPLKSAKRKMLDFEGSCKSNRAGELALCLITRKDRRPLPERASSHWPVAFTRSG